MKKENEFLKGKCENSDIALVKLIEEVMGALQKLIVLNQNCRLELLITISLCLLAPYIYLLCDVSRTTTVFANSPIYDAFAA